MAGTPIASIKNQYEIKSQTLEAIGFRLPGGVCGWECFGGGFNGAENGLRLGDAGPGLDVRVEREGDGRQDADDGDDDHQLDEREAALVAPHLLVPEAQHVRVPLVL